MGIAQRIVNLFTGMNWMIIPAALFTIVLHEISHGYIAYLLGDRTAKDSGRLTLNPIKHLDVIGLLSMIIFGFGWAKPVPVNPYYFKHRKGGMALTALAGPMSNLLLALLGLLCFKGLTLIPITSQTMYVILNGLAQFLYIFAMLNVGLAIFNLIPIPPLDGSKVVNALLPNEVYFKIMKYEQFGFLVLLVLLNIPIFERWITTAQTWVLSGLSTMVGL